MADRLAEMRTWRTSYHCDGYSAAALERIDWLIARVEELERELAAVKINDSNTRGSWREACIRAEAMQAKRDAALSHVESLQAEVASLYTDIAILRQNATVRRVEELEAAFDAIDQEKIRTMTLDRAAEVVPAVCRCATIEARPDSGHERTCPIRIRDDVRALKEKPDGP